MRDTLSTMPRLVEARAQFRQAPNAVADDRPDLAASLAEITADVDERRWILTEERATSQSRGVDRHARTGPEGVTE